MLLDLVELAMSHSGKNLAEAFEKVLKDFGVSDKVSFFKPNIKTRQFTFFFYLDPQRYERQRFQ